MGQKVAEGEERAEVSEEAERSRCMAALARVTRSEAEAAIQAVVEEEAVLLLAEVEAEGVDPWVAVVAERAVLLLAEGGAGGEAP